MATAARARILPMRTAGTEHLIERAYREGGPYQWVRETWMNAHEAGATRIEFGIEWQAVETLGVYRRSIADNGSGMTAEDLVAFFNTFGGGGKPIGGVHENFGVGAKTSLLPWNRLGIVVVSWVDGDPSMIWVQQDPATGEYGLKLEEVDDLDTGEISLDEVYGPYADDIHGCNWEAVKPSWMGDHGTVIMLLGNSPGDDTVLGDPDRPETDIKGISSYLNRRIWQIPNGLQVVVNELRTQERKSWGSTSPRTLQGAKYYVEYPVERADGRLAHSGTVRVSDGTDVHWYLWEGSRPQVGSYAAVGGYIATLYKNELYDITSHNSTYRSFGITESTVRNRLWLVIEPPELDDDGKHGVYPRTDRNALLLKGGPNAGGPLPINDWGGDFADLLPDPILAAIKAARIGEAGTVSDDAWRDRLAERFGSRWRIWKLRARSSGTSLLDPTQDGTSFGAGSKPKKKKGKKRTSAKSSGGTAGALNTGSAEGPIAAKRSKVAGGIPSYRKVGASELDAGMLAAWLPYDPVSKEGAVLLNVEHPVIETEILYWQGQYPDHYADDIAKEVTDIYGEIAVAKVAHSEHLKGLLPSKRVDDELRSDAALTMALLGLVGEEAVIAPRVGGKFKKRRSASGGS